MEVELGPAAGARRMRPQGALEPGVDAIDMDVQLVLRALLLRVHGHADIVPGQRPAGRRHDGAAVAPGLQPEILRVPAQQDGAFHAGDPGGRHDDDAGDVAGGAENGETVRTVEFQAGQGQAGDTVHRRAEVVHDAPEVARVGGVRVLGPKKAQAGHREKQEAEGEDKAKGNAGDHCWPSFGDRRRLLQRFGQGDTGPTRLTSCFPSPSR